MSAPPITQKQVMGGLLADSWKPDWTNPSFEYRYTEVIEHCVTFTQKRHIDTWKVTFTAIVFQDNSDKRWGSITNENLDVVLAWANERRQSAVDALASRYGNIGQEDSITETARGILTRLRHKHQVGSPWLFNDKADVLDALEHLVENQENTE